MRPKIPIYVPEIIAELILKCWDALPDKRPSSEEIDETINIWNNQIANDEQTELIVQTKKADEMVNNLVFTQPHSEMHPDAIYVSTQLDTPNSTNFDKQPSHLDDQENIESLLVIDPFQISQPNSNEEVYDEHLIMKSQLPSTTVQCGTLKQTPFYMYFAKIDIT
ncbi:24515_t:CDS:2 [Gigaspora margarita]|uniref:24515_t:CDS:1 n=1 Tax=Gigaspora margarita TaxID=4874 RepID=A0ABM8W4P4_GIGMA|nr:24515_t:CDS:2 [Gigaspora margarita]